MNGLRLAVIGAGHLGRIHARLAGQLEDARLVAVVDPDVEARTAAVRGTSAVGVADYRDVLKDIDAAIVATPTVLHHQVCADLLQQGVSTLVEKPIATTIQQARQLCELAEAHRAVLQVGHVERFNPAFQHLQPQIADPKFIQAVRIGEYSFRSTDIGVVHDLMIHDLDLVLQLAAGNVRQVSAFGIAAVGQHEDAAHARVEFDGGCIAEFTACRVSYHTERTMQIWSADCFAALDLHARSVTVVRPRRPALEQQLQRGRITIADQTTTPESFFSEMFSKESWQDSGANPILDEQRDFVASILGGHRPQVSGEAGLRALELAEQIALALQAHAWDGRADGRHGPLAAFPPQIFRPSPRPEADQQPERRAG